MMFKNFITFLLLLMALSYCDSKGGRGGGGFRGGGGSRGKSSSGSSWGSSWFSSGKSKSSSPSYSSPSYSRPSPSYSAPAYSPSSYNSPSASPSYGWNINSNSPSYSSGSAFSNNAKPSYGWNVGNTQTAPKPATGTQNIGWNFGNTQTAAKPATSSGSQNIGWNVGSKPVGPPPAYPGLANRPLSNPNAPPAYSPSYSNPPAYNPSYSRQPAYNPSYPHQPAYNPSYTYGSPSYASKPSYSPSYNRQHNSYNTHSSYPSYNSQPSYPAYGSTFGSNGLAGNTYIHNNYYGSSRSGGGSSFLTNALFYGAGMHHGHMWGSSSSRRSWDSEEDRRWRSTTKAPYFENKVPGSESYLPAAAVVGAATAFGLASLLPLNVPGNKPLMYCNNTEIAQMNIKLDDNVYSCVNNSISISCPRIMENSTIIDECLNLKKTMECDVKVVEGGIQEDLYCTNATLLSRSGIVCNSTVVMNGTAEVNETSTILNCYPGQLPEKLASFVPTTTTEAPLTTTTEKQLSIGARMHMFFLKIIGKGAVLERPVTSTEAPIEDPRLTLKENETLWIPEALTIPPESTTTEEPFDWMQKLPETLPNGTQSSRLVSISPEAAKLYQILALSNHTSYKDYADQLVKVPRTSTQSPKNETSTVDSTILEQIIAGTNSSSSIETSTTNSTTIDFTSSSTDGPL